MLFGYQQRLNLYICSVSRRNSFFLLPRARNHLFLFEEQHFGILNFLKPVEWKKNMIISAAMNRIKTKCTVADCRYQKNTGEPPSYFCLRPLSHGPVFCSSSTERKTFYNLPQSKACWKQFQLVGQSLLFQQWQRHSSRPPCCFCSCQYS